MTLKQTTIAYRLSQIVWWLALAQYVWTKGASWIWLAAASAACLIAWLVYDAARRHA